MINVAHIEKILRQRYPDLEPVGERVFRGVDRYAEREYAIRYFDLNDQLTKTAPSLKRYQEEMLSEAYFSPKTATDLRWNHYLYFVTSIEQAQQSEFKRSKATVEADREYARKQVVFEEELESFLAGRKSPKPSSSLPADLATTWMKRLDDSGLGFVLDDQMSVPEVVRRIAAAQKDKATNPVSPMALLPSEAAAGSHFLKHLTIHGFRPHPTEKQHPLGRVNLVVGTNGVGKTSLLEAIEYVYCGRNRRAGVVTADTSVIAEMAGSGEKLSSTTAPARLRARHSNWYAKAELKTVTIEDSFGKFNFLDTDAAVNLSVATSTQQIGADVARLVLGAEAEKLGDRLRRVRDKLQEELKDLHRDSSANELLRQEAQNRLEALKSAPKLSDGLFTELLAMLRQIGWHELPSSKGVVATLREALQRAIASVRLLHHSGTDVLRSDEEGLQQFWKTMDEAAQQATDLDGRHKAAMLDAAEAQRKLQASANHVAAIDALLPYAQADFHSTLAHLQTLQQAVGSRSARLAALRPPPQAEHVADFLDQTAVNATTYVVRRLDELRQRLKAAQSSAKAFEATQSALTLLRQRLLSTAQELLQRVPNPDHCPVCHTDFDQGQLLVRMLADATSEASDQPVRFQSEIADIEAALKAAQAAEFTLHSLAAFLGDRASSLSVAEALALAESERAALISETAELSTAQESLVRLQSNGLTAIDLSQKLAAAGASALQTEAELQLLRATAVEALANLRADLEAAQQSLSIVQKETETLATRFSLTIPIAPAELVQQIRNRLASFETAMEARQSLLPSIQVGSGTTLESLVVNLTTAQELLVKVVTADARETSEDAALAKETKAINDFKHRAEVYKTKTERLTEADGVLEELTRQSSGGELAERILADNAHEIARTFASIHVPNEFDLKPEKGRLRIIRRRSGSEVELNQMSTGQRAAFALSLFLAMNARLQSGPPVLLFDDPVAHVDDINVLSFLDHLRDLAIKGSRQIFFATADTKLAGLFRHKFRFLGPNGFREIQLTRD